MAHDSLGTQNQPQYAGGGAPADAADLSEVSNYAALVGNRKTGSASLRGAASGANVWEGLIWGDTTDGFEYRYTSGAWAVMLPKGAKIPLGDSYGPTVASPLAVSASMAAVTGASVTAKSHGGSVRVWAHGWLQNANSGAFRTGTVQIMCDGILVSEASPAIALALASGVVASYDFNIRVKHTPTAASHTWTLQASASAAGATVFIAGVTLEVEEYL